MDLISSITSSLGVDPQSAKGAAGSVLALLKQQAPPETFAAVEQKVPESSEWLAAAPSPQGEGTGDLLGGLAGALGGLGGSGTGGGAGGGLLGGLAGLGGLISALSKLGLSADSLGKLVPLVLTFLQSRLGEGTLARLLEAVPALAGLKPGAQDQQRGDSPLGGLTDLFK